MSINKEQMVAYLEIKRSKLQAHSEKEVCSSIRAEISDQTKGYAMAIKDLANWLNPDFEPDVDYEDIVSHIASKNSLDF